jgi:PPP family 3-phenylpropionic acid transporter
LLSDKKITSRRINVNFSAIQGAYWMSATPYLMFAAVFLGYRGLSNSQIGYTMSASAIGAILIQTILSDFSDNHPNIPLKRILAIIFTVVIAMSAALSWVPYPIAIIMTAFIIGQTCITSSMSLINALSMQMQNAGLKINFGLSRAIGSLFFAITAYILGIVVENNSPELLYPIQILMSIVAITFILALPRPEKVSGKHPDQVGDPVKHSIFVMLKENPTFVMLMIALIVTFIGQSYFGFLINVIRNVGGDTANLGTTLSTYALVEIVPMTLSLPLLKKFGAKTLLLVSIIALFVKILIISFATNIVWIYISAAANMFSNGIYFFASVYFVNEIVKPNERTRGQALIGLCSFGGIGTVIGASIIGSLLDRYGTNAMMLFCGILTFIGIVLIFIMSHMHKKHFINTKGEDKDTAF